MAFGKPLAEQGMVQAQIAESRGASEVIDRAIRVHGGVGVSDDVPLAAMYGWHRAMRLFDGPDEVNLRSFVRHETTRRG